MGAIECRGLSKHYGEVKALDNLNLDIEESRVFGFLGPNGAGKTTTVKLLTGLSTPTAGKAFVAGEEVSHGNLAFRSKIGYLPDVPSFYNWMKGREFLSFIGELHKIPPSELGKRCDELLELVDLKEAGKRKVGGYSRGMKQRLGIAQALINRPKVLFMDEPTSALDPVGRREVLSLIEHLGNKTTVFMSTHILSDVERVCDEVGIIDKGKLVTVSNVSDIKKKYSTQTFEMEFEEPASELLTKLLVMPWVLNAEIVKQDEKPVMQVKVNDEETAKREMPAIVAASGFTLLRYELTMPSLEDIFVELVRGAK